jgi:hypothetical protein
MRLVIALPLAAAIFVAAPAFARDDRPVACIYAKSHRIARPDIVALVRSGFNPTSGAEKTAMMTLADAVRACRAQFGWADKRQGVALRYMSGRVLHEDAVYRGQKSGLTDEILGSIVGALDPAGRAAYVAGRPTPELNRAAMAALKGAGVAVDSLTAEDLTALGSIIGEGVTGMVVQQDAEAGFAAS